MKIMMLCEYSPPFDRGGAEWSAYHLALALQNKGHAVSIFTPDYGKNPPHDIKNIRITRFPYYLKLKYPYQSISPFHQSHLLWWFWTTCWLVIAVLKSKPQILHVQGKYFIPQAVIAGKFFKLPVVVTLRDYILLCPHGYCLRHTRNYRACNLIELLTCDLPEFYKQFQIKSRLNRFLVFLGTLNAWTINLGLKFFLMRANVTVGISKKLTQIYMLNGISLSTTIYNTFSPPQIKKLKCGKYLLFVGRLTPGKGFPLLIHVLRVIHLPSIPKLIVIGEGVMPKKIKLKKIEFLGQLSYTDTLNFIAHAQFVIVPSVWEEPFGRVALEAIMFGVPVVTTNRGGLPEIVQDGLTGVIVEPDENSLAEGIMKALKKERNLRKNIQKLKYLLRHKFERQPVAQYEKIYESL